MLVWVSVIIALEGNECAANGPSGSSPWLRSCRKVKLGPNHRNSGHWNTRACHRLHTGRYPARN